MENNLDSIKEIEKIAFSILKGSKSFGKLPTPVNDIVNYCELKVNKEFDLSKIYPTFVTKKIHLLNRAINKVLGAIDFRTKEIYLDLTQTEGKQTFIKLHEIGHSVLPWQREIFEFCDDRYSLDLDQKEIFELEANYFGSYSLFQGELFEDEAIKLPLEITSAMVLAKKFGSSVHAALRRYVEYSTKLCALIIFDNLSLHSQPFKIKNYFQSTRFTEEFGKLDFINYLNIDFPFIADITSKRKFHKDGIFKIVNEIKKVTEFEYHFFNNFYNTFIFFKPRGEINSVRTKVYVRS